MISYGISVVILLAAAAGGFLGIRAAAGAVKERAQAREEARQAAIEESLAEESMAAESAVAAMLEQSSESQQETETETETYSIQDALEELVLESVGSLTLEQKVAGLFIVTPEQITGVGQAIQAGDGTKEALEKYPVGGLIYTARNIQSQEQIQQMLSNTVSYSAFPLFLGVAEEGGDQAGVAEALGLEHPASMAQIGASGDVQAAVDAGGTISSYLASCGFNLDFAPVADVLVNAESPIGDRAFSGDAQVVSQMVTGMVQGLQGSGVSACLKYFPGMGSASGDPAEGIAETVRTKEEMTAEEFVPFAAGIAAGCDMIMVGNVTPTGLLGEDSVPASLSEDVITGILRNELSYNGIVITGALDMAAVTEYYESDIAAIMALKAGADMVLMPQDFEKAYEGVIDAVHNGTISEERIDDSLARIYRVKLRGRIS